MNNIEPISLSSLIKESKDGEWGKSTDFPNAQEMIVIRGTDFEKVKAGYISGIPIRYIPNSIASRKQLCENDILIETAGGTEDKPTGRVVFVSKSFIDRFSCKKFTCASFSRFIRIDSQKAYPAFIYWYLQFLYDARISYMFHTQHTGVARFQWTKFSNYKLFILPKYTTQQRIASILSAYDDLIEVNNQRIQLLEETARELYKEWFVRMRFPGWKETKFVKGVPEGWELLRIGDLMRIKNGKETGLVAEGAFRVYGSNGQIGFSDNFNYEDVLIIGRVGAYCGSIEIGNSKIWATDNTLVALPNFRKSGFYFCYHLLKYLDLGNYAGGSAQPLLTQSIINRLKVMAPSEHLVDNFEKNAKPIFQQIETLHQQNTQLRQIRDRLLPRLISGKLQIKEA